MIARIKQTILILGDILALYASLSAALLIRYGTINPFLVRAHLGPFSIIFALWIAIFYILGLYDLQNLKNRFQFVRQFGLSVFIGTVASIILFYIIPYFTISPKTNLALFAIVFSLLGLGWRTLFNSRTKTVQRRVILLGHNDEIGEIASTLAENPQMGLLVSATFPSAASLEDPGALEQAIALHHVRSIIFDAHMKLPAPIIPILYRCAANNIEILDSRTAYEIIFKKLSLETIEHAWAVTTFSRQEQSFEIIKEATDRLFALALTLLLSPLLVALYALVRITSKGPGIYRQVRLGRNEKPFSIYKFRTMVQDAEKEGAKWASKDDPRITPLGKALRFSHLDELPQLFNILKGDISFVGPRPERPEFMEQLKKGTPYYELRHAVKPGLTGWAQVSYRYGSSAEDSFTKLQYDMYYIKNRSFIFDILIILKTIKMFLFNYS
jgi:exopolysaccharide biosynthesis polyprenyl glycosylphosphotransferase